MVADIVLLLIIGVNLFFGFKRGFMRNALRMVTGLFSLIFAFFLAKPVSVLLDSNFHLVDKITPWLSEHAGFISNFLKNNQGKVALFLMTFVGLFIVIRLTLIIADHYLKKLKNSSAAINFLDKTLGLLFGLVMASVYVVALFFAVDSLSSIGIFENLPDWIQLTEKSGGFLAWRTYQFSVEHVFGIVKDIITGITTWAINQATLGG
jgi:uncharacterized membrane protein required for colicin V production